MLVREGKPLDISSHFTMRKYFVIRVISFPELPLLPRKVAGGDAIRGIDDEDDGRGRSWRRRNEFRRGKAALKHRTPYLLQPTV